MLNSKFIVNLIVEGLQTVIMDGAIFHRKDVLKRTGAYEASELDQKLEGDRYCSS